MLNKYIYISFFIYFIIIKQVQPIHHVMASTSKPSPARQENRTSEPCQICRELVKSFYKGLNSLTKKKLDDNFKTNEISEAKFKDIYQNICKDLTFSKDECRLMAEMHDSAIKSWWSTYRIEGKDLNDFLCIDSAKHCCPFNTYGPQCLQCIGCSNHGYCKGNGTRKGTGECICSEGYRGEKCNICDSNYYKDDKECKKCDSSCKGCHGKGSKNCDFCKEGYGWDSDYGCLDIDECLELDYNPCGKNTFCVNNEGSYTCFECDKACDGCNGDGPDMCKKCAEGFVLKNDICIDTKNRDREIHLKKSRYATYVGLCLATCIIFRKNMYIASAIGLAVATYISLAEYTVRGTEMIHPLQSFFKSILP